MFPQGGLNQESVHRGREFPRAMWPLNEAKQQGLIPTVPSSERLSRSYSVEKNALCAWYELSWWFGHAQALGFSGEERRH